MEYPRSVRFLDVGIPSRLSSGTLPQVHSVTSPEGGPLPTLVSYRRGVLRLTILVGLDTHRKDSHVIRVVVACPSPSRLVDTCWIPSRPVTCLSPCCLSCHYTSVLITILVYPSTPPRVEPLGGTHETFETPVDGPVPGSWSAEFRPLTGAGNNPGKGSLLPDPDGYGTLGV